MVDVANMLQKGCRRGCTACGRLWCPPYSTFACDQPSSWLSSTDSTTPTFFFQKKTYPYIFPTFFLHVSYIFTPFFPHIFATLFWPKAWCSLELFLAKATDTENSLWTRVIFHGNLLGTTVDGPAKSKSPVENGGKHPIIYKVSTIQDFATIYCSSMWWWCYNHWNEHVFFHRNTILLLNNIITNEL